MPRARHVSPAPLVAALLILGASGTARAASETEGRHALWRDCLSRNFRIQAALTGRDSAADAAFQACRSAEDAYLDALAGSPLLADDDIARARPLLAGRIRAWLVGSRG
jgi:isoaspartyl peptidase/L-asparaginase-like protein (Ntn-hydrolase superfamily)